MHARAGMIFVVSIAALGSCTPARAPDARVDAIEMDANGPYARAAIASLAARLQGAEARWRATNPDAPFAGAAQVEIAPDGALADIRPVRPLGDSAFSFVIAALDGARVAPTGARQNARLTIDIKFALPPEEQIAPRPPSVVVAPELGPSELAAREAHASHLAQCDAGDTFQCVNVGYDLQKGLGVKQDEALAATYYTRACDTKSRDGAEGCADLAWLAEMGLGIPKNEPRARDLYKLGCELGAKLGCNNLGVMYRDGRGGLPKDFQSSVKFFSKACDMLDYAGCANLGYMHSKGEGVPKNGKRAIELYTLACDHDNAYGCHNLGYRYQEGDGVAKDTRKAGVLYKKACDGGELDACVNLGGLHQFGDGVALDAEAAVRLYLKACDGKQAHGCQYLGTMYKDGSGVGKDDARAAAYFKRGCDLGDQPSCAELSALKRGP